MTCPHPPPAASLRVLVVDADRMSQRIASGLLARLGHTPAGVGSAGEALAALRLQAHDVVLVAVEPPDLSGLEIARSLRSDRTVPTRPRLIALTSSDAPAERAACQEAGLDDVLVKPLRPEALAAALARGRDAPGALPGADGVPLPVLDRGRLAELEANLGPSASAVLGPLLDRFPAEGERLVREARQALAGTRLVELHRLAHTLKGAGANLGLCALSAAARDLETRARTGEADGLEPLCDRLEQELGRATRALEALHAGRSVG